MLWLIKAAVLVSCFLGFATAGYLAGLSRVRGIDQRLNALETASARVAYESEAKRKIGALMIQMDEHIGIKCDHSGPHFIAENSQGTYCLDCGAKIKD